MCDRGVEWLRSAGLSNRHLPCDLEQQLCSTADRGKVRPCNTASCMRRVTESMNCTTIDYRESSLAGKDTKAQELLSDTKAKCPDDAHNRYLDNHEG